MKTAKKIYLDIYRKIQEKNYDELPENSYLKSRDKKKEVDKIVSHVEKLWDEDKRVDIEQAMIAYGKQVLDYAAENAEIFDANKSSYSINANYIVDKESILKLKEELK